jgi:nucleotide-binding universal stress UspA family protein
VAFSVRTPPQAAVKVLDARFARLRTATVSNGPETPDLSASGASRPDSRPVLFAYDGRPGSEHTLREAAGLLAAGVRRPARVVVVVKPGLAFELIELPTTRLGLPPSTLDVRAALETAQELYAGAQEAAARAAGLLREFGLEAEGLAVAEDPDVTVAETLVRLAGEWHAQAIVVSAHRHGSILGSTTRAVVRDGPCPTLVVREA